MFFRLGTIYGFEDTSVNSSPENSSENTMVVLGKKGNQAVRRI